MIQAILAQLQRVRRSGDGWSARWPAHDDQHVSLSIGKGDDGRVLLHCHAGCEPQAICQKLGIELADLFPERGGAAGGSSSRVRLERPNGPGLTLEQYAQAKALPIEFLQQLGLSQCTHSGGPAVRIPYHGPDGIELAVQFRTALTGENRFRWRKGSRPVPYGLAQLDAARAAGEVVIVEGASDAQTLWHQGILALGIPGAAGWRPVWDQYLVGIAQIYVVIEPDAGGEAVERWLARAAFRDRARLVRLEIAKDPSELYLQNPEAFLPKFQTALAQAVPWTQILATRRQETATQDYEVAKELLLDEHLLDRIGGTMRAAGYAGSLAAPKLAYIAITSRLTGRRLAELIPAGAVRMRRDFPQLLACVQAVALLHVCQRVHNPQGSIQAAIQDYRNALELLAPIFDASAQDAITPVIRQTVESVQEGEEVTLGALALRLDLAKSTVSWRVKRALAGGWLVNVEQRRGHAARLKRGAPLPDLASVLPAPEVVQQGVSECSNGPRDSRAPLPPATTESANPAGAGVPQPAQSDNGAGFIF